MIKYEGIYAEGVSRNDQGVNLYNQAINGLCLEGLAYKKQPHVQDGMKMKYIFNCLQAALVIYLSYDPVLPGSFPGPGQT